MRKNKKKEFKVRLCALLSANVSASFVCLYGLMLFLEQTPNLQDVHIHTLHLSSGTVYTRRRLTLQFGTYFQETFK